MSWRRDEDGWFRVRWRSEGALRALALSTTLLFAGCPQASNSSGQKVSVDLKIDPSPPAVGVANLDVTLTDAAGQPVRVQGLEVEGNMNHAGMKPVFTTLKETEPGHYAGEIEFTMGGDWFLLLTGESADGGPLNEKVDVPGVKPK